MVSVMLHANRTVSVGISGDLNSSRTQQRIQIAQKALDKSSVGAYTIGTGTLDGSHGLIKVDTGNRVGVCAEPKCAFVAKNNPSPVIGFAILWCGRGVNPYPLSQKELSGRNLSSNQMYMCDTCQASRLAYERYINNANKK